MLIVSILTNNALANAVCGRFVVSGEPWEGRRCVQFHLNGFEPGDPEISDRSQRYPASGAAGPLPDEVRRR